MRLRSRLPQLPAHHKPPQHSTPNSRKPSKEESQNCWFPTPLVKHRSYLQRPSFISLCYSKCASIQAYFENITLLSCATHFLCPAIQRWPRFTFILTGRLTLCTSRLGETFPHMPFAAILLLAPSGRMRRQNLLRFLLFFLFAFVESISNPSHQSKICFLFFPDMRFELWIVAVV